MLIGPRVKDGELGYMVVTPFEIDVAPEYGGGGSGSSNSSDGQGRLPAVLVNRGWISKSMGDQRRRDRRHALPGGTVRVEGLLRKPWKKNMFTPDNRPDKGEFYFPDVEQMASLTGSQPIWIEATMGECLIVGSCAADLEFFIFSSSVPSLNTRPVSLLLPRIQPIPPIIGLTRIAPFSRA
jgi:surfeit locus 1 family protein